MPPKGKSFRRRWEDEILTEDELTERLVKNGFYERYLRSSWDYDHRLAVVRSYLLTEYVCSSKNPSPNQKRGLIVCGTLGIGKSSLLGLIAKSLLSAIVAEIRYSTTENFLDLFSGGNYDEAYAIRNCQILCLDDLAWENSGSGEFRMAKLVELFKYRYGRELPTFIGTNLSNKDLYGKESEHIGYKQIANLLQDKQWIMEFNYGYNENDTKRGAKDHEKRLRRIPK